MRMTALIIAECVGVMSTQNFKLLTSITQLYFGDAARTSFTICDHCLSIGMQVVVSIRTARGVVVCLDVICAIRSTPATKAKYVIAGYTAVKTEALSIRAPEFMLIPLVGALAGNDLTLPVGNIEQPHSVWQFTVFMTKQNKLRIM